MSENKLKIGLETQEQVGPIKQKESSRISSVYQKIKNISNNKKRLISINLLLALIGFITVYLFTTRSLVAGSLSIGLIYAFIILETIFLLFVMIFSTKNLRFTKFRLLFMVGAPLLSLTLISLLSSEGNLLLASQVPV
ncbi:hypothetical protein LCGC14_2320200, partial [marine sediment metagenome]